MDFWRIFRREKADGTAKTEKEKVTCNELAEIAREAAIRELAFDACVNMIARYIATCEIKTYKDKKPITEREYYLWNVEPNINQNKTAFFHKLVRTLYLNNEALIIETGSNDTAGFVVADSFDKGSLYPVKQNTYTGVTVGDMQYNKTFREKEVMHLVLDENPVKPVVDQIYESYYDLINGAMTDFTWNRGKHWKVHVDQIASGDKNFAEEFQQVIDKQVKPFLTAKASVLPEFDGYTYTDVSESRTSRTSTGESADVRQLIEDIFDFTAMAFGIPSVLVKGKVENTNDAKIRFYTLCDTIIRQLEQEANRKRYGFAEWKNGNYIRIDSSNVEHFSLLDNSANFEKLIGSAVYSVNDTLRAIGQPTINEPWADMHFLTKNIGVLNNESVEMTAGTT